MPSAESEGAFDRVTQDILLNPLTHTSAVSCTQFSTTKGITNATELETQISRDMDIVLGCLLPHITRRGTLLVATPLPSSSTQLPHIPTLLLRWCPSPTLIHLLSAPLTSTFITLPRDHPSGTRHPRHLPPKTFYCPQPLPLPFAHSLYLSLSLFSSSS